AGHQGSSLISLAKVFHSQSFLGCVRAKLVVEDQARDLRGRGATQVAYCVHATGDDGGVAPADVLTRCPGSTHGDVVPKGRHRNGQEEAERTGRKQGGEVANGAQTVTDDAEQTPAPLAVPGSADEPVGQEAAGQASDCTQP